MIMSHEVNKKVKGIKLNWKTFFLGFLGLHQERSEVNEGDTKRHVQMRLDLRNGGCNGCS